MTSGLQITLVRHAETEWTERGRLHGRLDSPLSETGRRHARLTAHTLRGASFDALYSSPRGRAIETAAAIGEAVGLAPIPLEGLREMNYGWLEGLPLSLVDPDGTGAWLLRPLVHAFMGLTGERERNFAARVTSTLEALTVRHPTGRLLVVTHWGVLSMLMAHLTEGHGGQWRRFGPWTACGISELHLDGSAWRVVRLNESGHLERRPALAKEEDLG